MKKRTVVRPALASALKRAICILMTMILCASLLPMASADVDYSAVCRLTPSSASFAAGEDILFTLSAQYATPGDDTKPGSVTYGIPIPATTPAVQLPMFYMTGSGTYEGVPMYPLSFNGLTIELYLMTGASGERWIEFTLDAGSTIQGNISMVMPNGVSQAIPAFTLTPVILSSGDYGANILLQGGTVAITAGFGWNDVQKTGSTDNLGVVSATPQTTDRISYSITASSLSSGVATGRIFTEHYTLTDTLSLAGLNYADGALSSSEASGLSTFSIGGTPVLEIGAPLSSLTVTKTASGGLISAFNIQYSAYNTTLNRTDGSAQELPSLNLPVTLLLAGMRLNAGNEDTLVTNTAAFDAYSPYGDHHHSTAVHTARTQDRYTITKGVFLDEECTQPAVSITDASFVWYKVTAINSGSSTGPFRITDVLPNGLSYVEDDNAVPAAQSGQTLTWEGLTIPSGSSHTIIIKAQFSLADLDGALTLHNVANLYDAAKLLSSASADCSFLTGETTDAEISYGKTANKTAAKVNDTLTYTITVRNSNTTVPKLITVVDKWPGNGIRPTGVTGCGSFVLLDAQDREYTLEQVAADPAIIIDRIKCYNVSVPAGGSARLTITGVVTAALDELVNQVGVGSAGAASAKVYGVSISKAPYAFTPGAAAGDNGTLGATALTAQTPVNGDDIVCYVMTVKNLKSSGVAGASLVDMLPEGLSLESVTYQNATGSVILNRGSTYTALGVTGDASNVQTTATFDLAVGESVRIFLFARVSSEAVSSSTSSAQRITNRAYLRFNSVQTGNATANIYTNVDTSRKISMTKWFKFVADLNDDLSYKGTMLQDSTGADANCTKDNAAVVASVWNGAYVGYQLQIKNASDTAKNIQLYEIVDTLPEGMEFIGIAKESSRATYDNLVLNKMSLADALISSGETAHWVSGSHNTYISVNYDETTRKITATFVNSAGDPAPESVIPSSINSDKLFMLIVARVKDSNTATSFSNTAEVKVDSDVKLDTPLLNELRSDGEYGYVSAGCAAATIGMTPGNLKKFIGHYFPSGSTVPASVTTTDGINPGESLRFTVQAMNQGAGNAADTAKASLRDFTVTDYLPAEYVYRPNSAMAQLNIGYNTQNYQATTAAESTLARGAFEPSIERLDDGRTKLTWTFSGVNQRLKCNTLASKAGFMHLITYDVDWNTNYLPSYGNYTNTAYVNHKYDITSSSVGLMDAGNNTVASSAVVNVFGAVGTTALKSITSGSTTVNGNGQTNTVPVAGAGSSVTYTLDVTNSMAAAQGSNVKSLVIIDELPRASGDTGVVNRTARGSDFSVLFGGAPNVAVKLIDTNNNETTVDGDDYTLWYGNSNGGLNSSGDWSGSSSGGRVVWSTDSNGKNAIRIAFRPDYAFGIGETIRVSFTAVAGEDADPGETAWNSFGYSYIAAEASGAQSEKIFAEPKKVGATVPGAQLRVSKVVASADAPADTLFTFVLKQGGTAVASAKYTVTGDSAELRTTADGSFKLKAGQTAVFSVPPGSGYTVEELSIPTDYSISDMTPAASLDGDYEAPVFTFRAVAAGESVGVICENLYTLPPTR